MRMSARRAVAAGFTLVAPVALAISAQGAPARSLPGTPCSIFPADNYWHTDVA
ncbi:MAG: hypothetical protein QOF18_2248, partial [Frankiaceae bacterium]|nr:hypothetical protein [Frankiaceae bacterium]